MAEIEGRAEIQPFLDLVHDALGSFTSTIPTQIRYELARLLVKSSSHNVELRNDAETLENDHEGHEGKIQQIIEAELPSASPSWPVIRVTSKSLVRSSWRHTVYMEQTPCFKAYKNDLHYTSTCGIGKLLNSEEGIVF